MKRFKLSENYPFGIVFDVGGIYTEKSFGY